MEPYLRRKLHHEAPSAQTDENDGEKPNISIRERFQHFTWANFSFPLATGGLSVLLSVQPHTFTGLEVIGKIFYIFTIVIFLCCLAAITWRFIMVPPSLRASLTHPTESLMFPTAILSTVNIFDGASAYGTPHCGIWLLRTLQVMFWIYVAISFLSAILQYLSLMTAPPIRLTIHSMLPAWILPIFPIMLSGTFASAIASHQHPHERMPIIIAGITFQGLGWMVAFLMFAVYIHRLIEFGLPAPNLRPGMFLAVGPPSFTSLALIGISNALPEDFEYFASRPYAVGVLQVLADFAAIFMWALACWFFFMSTIAILMGIKKMSFHLAWWSFVFPNVGFTTATIDIGKQLNSQGILWVGSAMTILIVAVWLFVFVSHIRAFLKKEIMMPGKDEDKDHYKEDDAKAGLPIAQKLEGV